MFDVWIPFRLNSAELDQRLSEGWFRSASTFFQAELLWLEESLRPLIQMRHVIDGELPSRSLRKLLRRNRRRFRVEIGPARLDEDRQRLYELTSTRFLGLVARELEPLVEGELPGVFATREIAVYDDDRLVAVSYFDQGRLGLASLIGLHDPAYSTWSLGLYTLLEEREHLRVCGGRYLYPGYVVPGMTMFDYKRRLGALQFLGDDGWSPHEPREERLERAAHAQGRLDALRSAVEAVGIPFTQRVYPGFWVGQATNRLRLSSGRPMVDSLLHLGPPTRGGRSFLIAEHLLGEDTFQLSRVATDPRLDLLEEYEAEHHPGDEYETSALRRAEVLLRSGDPEEIAARWAEVTR